MRKPRSKEPQHINGFNGLEDSVLLRGRFTTKWSIDSTKS